MGVDEESREDCGEQASLAPAIKSIFSVIRGIQDDTHKH